MASSARIDEIKKKFDENPRRYFAPLANEFRKAGELEQAIMICEEFLPQQAGHMSGHIVYGQALYESGRLPESRTVFETALALDPENLIALRHLGDIARSEGEPDAARQWYDRVLEADPRNDEIQVLIAALDAESGGSRAPSGDTTLVMEAMPPREASTVPELATIELDMDADFGLPPSSSAAAPEPLISGPPASQQVVFESSSLEGLEPTSAEAATADSMPSARDARAEGLEPGEFEVPTTPLERAAGLEPAEFEAPATAPARAEGFQSSEFEAPDRSAGGTESLLDLDASFSTDSDGTGVVAGGLDGLEPTGATQPPPPAASGSFPSLDFDDAPSAGATHPAATPVGSPNARVESAASSESMQELELDAADFGGMGGSETTQAERSMEGLPMMELTPAVIAAETQLMDAGAAYDSGTGEAREDVATSAPPPFVTETMAELYLKQGFREQALDVYRQLSSASPADGRLRARVAELEQEGSEETAVPAGTSVRDFFFRLATRRPGERGAHAAPPSDDDFASLDASPAPEVTAADDPAQPAAGVPEAVASAPSPWDLVSKPVAAPPASGALLDSIDDAELVESGAESRHAEPTEPEPATIVPAEREQEREQEPAVVGAVSSATERGAAAQGGQPAAGTIDALFGTRPASRSEDSAASALAQAFGGTADAPAIVGRPARAAAQELSLDSVFRDGPARPPRTSQSFSFDQFFSESAGTPEAAAARAPDAAPTGEPAERSADDIQQFNSWLQGLKQR